MTLHNGYWNFCALNDCGATCSSDEFRDMLDHPRFTTDQFGNVTSIDGKLVMPPGAYVTPEGVAHYTFFRLMHDPSEAQAVPLD